MKVPLQNHSLLIVRKELQEWFQEWFQVLKDRNGRLAIACLCVKKRFAFPVQGHLALIAGALAIPTSMLPEMIPPCR